MNSTFTLPRCVGLVLALHATAGAAQPGPRTDLHGDPLPPAALLRLGTLRLRHGDMVRNLGFFPDGRALISADWHGVHLWDAATGKHLRRFGDPRGRQFQSIAFSADGRTVALSMSEGDVELWDSANGRRRSGFQVGRFPSVVLAPDGKTCAILDHHENDRQELALRDAATGKLLQRLAGHRDRVHRFLFAPDGKTLISAGDDQAALVWDLTGQRTKEALPQLTPEELAARWEALMNGDAVKAQEAVGMLTALPQQAVPLLQQHLRPIAPADGKQLAHWIEELGSVEFRVRDRATAELEKQGIAAAPVLRRAEAASTSPEARGRIQRLLARLDRDPQRLREQRAVQVLEQIGAPARPLLEALASGVAETPLTRAAQASLARLARRSNEERGTRN